MKNSFGENIKKIRKEKGLTQSEFAKLIKKSLSSVQKYEAGDVSIPIEVIAAISQELGVPSSKIVGDFDSKYYKYGAIRNLLSFMGYIFEEVELYTDTGSNNFEYYSPTGNDFEPIYVIKNEKEEIQLTLKELDIFVNDIEKYVKFLISGFDSSKDYFENIDIDNYLTNEMISSIKEKIGFYGDEHVKPLNRLEELIWKRYLEINKDKN